jgi:hypothetical protein
VRRTELSFLERLVEEQKQKRRFSNKDLLRRISGNLMVIEEENRGEDILNESFPEHFHYMKHEDSINERRPFKNLG